MGHAAHAAAVAQSIRQLKPPQSSRPSAPAIRTGTSTNYSFALTDTQGTPTLYLNNTAQTPIWRQYTPYGEPRGSASVTPDNRGFLNKPLNAATGFTRLGAREYDPIIGRFISVDPIMDGTDPQQWNGYAYSRISPATLSDPSGLKQCGDDRCTTYETVTPGGTHTVHSGGSSASTRYTGRTDNGRPYPDTTKGEHWTPEYYAEFFYGTHISNAKKDHPVYSDMCKNVGEGCAGLDNKRPGVNWGVAGAMVLLLIAAAPECLAVAVICANAVGDGIVSFYGYGGGGPPARSAGAGAAGTTAKGTTTANTRARSAEELLASIGKEVKTAGVLDLGNGELIPLVSGTSSLRNYSASGHVEGQAALIMRERGATRGTLLIDNPNGVCGYCNSQVPTLLPEGAVLDVRTPLGSVPPSGRWFNGKTFTGNGADPKPRPR
ncbi:RHS repeat-associated core domain-containing protein [Micromonospora sp. WMMD735]